MNRQCTTKDAERLLAALDIFECRIQVDEQEFVLGDVEFIRDPRDESWALRQWSRCCSTPLLIAESSNVRAARVSFEDLFLDLGQYIVVVTLCSRSSSVFSLVGRILSESEEEVRDEG